MRVGSPVPLTSRSSSAVAPSMSADLALTPAASSATRSRAAPGGARNADVTIHLRRPVGRHVYTGKGVS